MDAFEQLDLASSVQCPTALVDAFESPFPGSLISTCLFGAGSAETDGGGGTERLREAGLISEHLQFTFF